MNSLFNLQAPELFERLSNSPDYGRLEDLFGEDFEDEEERRRRLAMLGNYNQRQSTPNPQVSTGYQERNPNLFDMFYL